MNDEHHDELNFLRSEVSRLNKLVVLTDTRAQQAEEKAGMLDAMIEGEWVVDRRSENRYLVLSDPRGIVIYANIHGEGPTAMDALRAAMAGKKG